MPLISWTFWYPKCVFQGGFFSCGLCHFYKTSKGRRRQRDPGRSFLARPNRVRNEIIPEWVYERLAAFGGTIANCITPLAPRPWIRLWSVIKFTGTTMMCFRESDNGALSPATRRRRRDSFSRSVFALSYYSLPFVPLATAIKSFVGKVYTRKSHFAKVFFLLVFVWSFFRSTFLFSVRAHYE